MQRKAVQLEVTIILLRKAKDRCREVASVISTELQEVCNRKNTFRNYWEFNSEEQDLVYKASLLVIIIIRTFKSMNTRHRNKSCCNLIQHTRQLARQLLSSYHTTHNMGHCLFRLYIGLTSAF